MGKVVSVEGSGDNAKVRVEFDQVGIKNLLLQFAGLNRLCNVTNILKREISRDKQ